MLALLHHVARAWARYLDVIEVPSWSRWAEYYLVYLVYLVYPRRPEWRHADTGPHLRKSQYQRILELGKRRISHWENDICARSRSSLMPETAQISSMMTSNRELSFNKMVLVDGLKKYGWIIASFHSFLFIFVHSSGTTLMTILTNARGWGCVDRSYSLLLRHSLHLIFNMCVFKEIHR